MYKGKRARAKAGDSQIKRALDRNSMTKRNAVLCVAFAKWSVHLPVYKKAAQEWLMDRSERSAICIASVILVQDEVKSFPVIARPVFIPLLGCRLELRHQHLVHCLRGCGR